MDSTITFSSAYLASRSEARIDAVRKLQCKQGFKQQGAVCKPIKQGASQEGTEGQNPSKKQALFNGKAAKNTGLAVGGIAVAYMGINAFDQRNIIKEKGLTDAYAASIKHGDKISEVIGNSGLNKEQKEKAQNLLGATKAYLAKQVLESRGFELADIDKESNSFTYRDPKSKSIVTIGSAGSNVFTFRSNNSGDVQGFPKYDMAFQVNESFAKGEGLDRKQAVQIIKMTKKAFKKQIELMPDDALLSCEAFKDDKLGEKRQSIYEKEGFSSLPGLNSKYLFAVKNQGKFSGIPESQQKHIASMLGARGDSSYDSAKQVARADAVRKLQCKQGFKQQGAVCKPIKENNVVRNIGLTIGGGALLAGAYKLGQRKSQELPINEGDVASETNTPKPEPEISHNAKVVKTILRRRAKDLKDPKYVENATNLLDKISSNPEMTVAIATVISTKDSGKKAEAIKVIKDEVLGNTETRKAALKYGTSVAKEWLKSPEIQEVMREAGQRVVSGPANEEKLSPFQRVLRRAEKDTVLLATAMSISIKKKGFVGVNNEDVKQKTKEKLGKINTRRDSAVDKDTKTLQYFIDFYSGDNTVRKDSLTYLAAKELARNDAKILVKVPAKNGRKAYSYYREGKEAVDEPDIRQTVRPVPPQPQVSSAVSAVTEKAAEQDLFALMNIRDLKQEARDRGIVRYSYMTRDQLQGAIKFHDANPEYKENLIKTVQRQKDLDTLKKVKSSEIGRAIAIVNPTLGRQYNLLNAIAKKYQKNPTEALIYALPAILGVTKLAANALKKNRAENIKESAGAAVNDADKYKEGIDENISPESVNFFVGGYGRGSKDLYNRVANSPYASNEDKAWIKNSENIEIKRGGEDLRSHNIGQKIFNDIATGYNMTTNNTLKRGKNKESVELASQLYAHGSKYRTDPDGVRSLRPIQILAGEDGGIVARDALEILGQMPGGSTIAKRVKLVTLGTPYFGESKVDIPEVNLVGDGDPWGTLPFNKGVQTKRVSTVSGGSQQDYTASADAMGKVFGNMRSGLSDRAVVNPDSVKAAKKKQEETENQVSNQEKAAQDAVVKAERDRRKKEADDQFDHEVEMKLRIRANNDPVKLDILQRDIVAVREAQEAVDKDREKVKKELNKNKRAQRGVKK